MQIRQIQSGFSLLEVMVALVILSVGLLGLAGMQVSGIRSLGNTSSYSIATLAVNDIAEKMRANQIAFDSGSYAVNFDGFNCAVAPNPYCAARNGIPAQQCNPIQLATFDVYTWYCGDTTTGSGVSNSLSVVTRPAAPNPPGVATSITCIDTPTTDARNCSPGSPYEIILEWLEINQDVDGTADMTTQSIYMRVLP